jgi:hypothetical protein
MKINMGTIDRIFRTIVGVALIGLTLGGVIGVWGWIGVIPLVTGLAGRCPLYLPLGISTCPTEK